jgi:metal-responsive CopG/Arc/MetJ family transcriptional regulator
MSVTERTVKKERINVLLPSSLLAELRELVPPRERSGFIAEATAQRLLQFKQQKALQESRGAWTDENHPELQTQEDVKNWLKELRASTNARIEGLSDD